MIDSISIRNFQSLAHIDLDLQPLTVIVGPSSSGKSAFIRALRALVGNRRGTDFITHGERVASISAHLASIDPLRSGTVTLTRSTQTSPNSYTLIPDDQRHPHHPKAEFTKLGGEVPGAISDFLGIPTEQIPLAVASQFDKPYLLDAPGTEVARVLGSLTNAHIILNGARESNRQKLAQSQTLRTRSADLQAIRDRVPEFQALKAQRTALDRAEALIGDAQKLQARLDRLNALEETATIASARIPALRDALAAIPEPADLEERIQAFLSARRRHGEFLASIRTVSDAQRAVQAAKSAVSAAVQEHTMAVNQLGSAMVGIASGFASYFREHGDPIDGRILVEDAATLAARYVAQLEG